MLTWRMVLIATLALAAPIRAVGAPPAQWSPRGIGGGGAMYAPTINPANPREISVACDMSPHFTSTDAGNSWSLIDFRQLQSGRDCAIRYTKDANIRWAINYAPAEGDDRARPARSVDGGKTWHSPPEHAWPSKRKATAIHADYDDPNRAIVSADDSEVWITLDGGKTFARKLSAFDKELGLHLAGVLFDGNTVYVCLNDALYLSSDGGITFQNPQIAGIRPLSFITSFAGGKRGDKVRFACVVHKIGRTQMTGADLENYAGVYVLDPGAKAWQLRTTGLPRDAGMFFVRMASNDADTIYVGGGNLGPRSAPVVCKSVDGGGTWTDAFQTSGNKNIAAAWAHDGGDFAWSYPEYVLGLDVAALDKNKLLVTDLGCVHLSDNGGETWRQAYTTPASLPRKVARGQRYISNGLEVISVWQVHWFDPATLFACATDIRGFRSVDGGKSWSFGYSGHTYNTMYRASTDPSSKTVYAAVSSVHDIYQSTYVQDKRIDAGKGGVLSTVDNGATWQHVGRIDKPVVWVEADPRNPGRVYASVANSKDGGIYVTHDARRGKGAEWMPLAAPPRTQGHPFNIHVLDDGAILCTYSARRISNGFTPSSGVFLSRDGGATWEDRSDFRMRFWTKDVVLDPADKTQNTWYAGVFHAWGKGTQDGVSGLYRTTDRGKSWTPLATSALARSGILNVESCAFDPARPGEFYFTTEYDGLFHCADIRVKNPVFTQVDSYPFKHPLRVQFNPGKPTEIWVTSFGNGIRVGETRP